MSDSVSDEILRMVHAFSDSGRKDEVRLMAGAVRAIEAQLAEARAEVVRLQDWRKNISSAIKTAPEFELGQWAGAKGGWGYHFEIVRYVFRQRDSALAANAELVKKLRGIASLELDWRREGECDAAEAIATWIDEQAEAVGDGRDELSDEECAAAGALGKLAAAIRSGAHRSPAKESIADVRARHGFPVLSDEERARNLDENLDELHRSPATSEGKS